MRSLYPRWGYGREQWREAREVVFPGFMVEKCELERVYVVVNVTKRCQFVHKVYDKMGPYFARHWFRVRCIRSPKLADLVLGGHIVRNWKRDGQIGITRWRQPLSPSFPRSRVCRIGTGQFETVGQ